MVSRRVSLLSFACRSVRSFCVTLIPLPFELSRFRQSRSSIFPFCHATINRQPSTPSLKLNGKKINRESLEHLAVSAPLHLIEFRAFSSIKRRSIFWKVDFLFLSFLLFPSFLFSDYWCYCSRKMKRWKRKMKNRGRECIYIIMLWNINRRMVYSMSIDYLQRRNINRCTVIIQCSLMNRILYW